jgi:hypothetical protein
MRSKSLIFLLMLLAVAAAGVAPLAAKSGQNPAVDGDYIVVFKGAYSGQGIAKVNGSGKMIQIKGDLDEVKRGKAGHFRVKNMPFTDDGHFSGSGKYICQDGSHVPVSVIGRLEPADNGVIKKSRIICTFTTESGEGGRIFGSH